MFAFFDSQRVLLAQVNCLIQYRPISLSLGKLLPSRVIGLVFVVSSPFLLSACIASGQPSNTADACKIFQEQRGWYRAALASEKRWNIGVPILMSVIKKESSFKSNARPPRKRGFLGLPGRRPSTALGFAQAKNETWGDYIRATKNKGANRTNFRDAIDFVGWYLNNAARVNRISRNSAHNLYIAYHEGLTGYRLGRWRGSSFVVGAAAKVDQQAKLYAQQMQNCRRGPARRYPSRR